MLELRDISFAYDTQKVIDKINFSVPSGHQIALIGESGCGKSTLLKLIYGLYDLEEGVILFDEKPVLGPKFNLIPGMDAMKYLAQDFDLMPFTTVAENVGKYLSNMYKVQKAARIRELLEMVEMTEYANVKAQYLSGGQQQRVALARVLALEPKLLLLDEPFSQIDAFRRNNLRRNLFHYLKDKHISCIMATHDTTDILGFADAAVVMKNGEMLRKDSPRSIYNNPTDFYTAALFGDVNEIPMQLFAPGADLKKKMFLYPHQIVVSVDGILQVCVNQCYFTGNTYLIASTHKNQQIFFEHPEPLVIGSTVALALKNSNQAMH